MVQLLPVLSYTSLVKGTYQIVSVKQQEYLSHKQEERTEVLFELLLPEPLPASISCNNELYFLSARDTTAYLRIPVEVGTLKYFFPDYKNYYYLPAEDMAVHKSVAAYVDKQHRQPAKPATCYTKKQGLFLPQKKPLHTPVFFKEYKDTLSYFELTNELLADSNFLSAYSMECIASITLP